MFLQICKTLTTQELGQRQQIDFPVGLLVSVVSKAAPISSNRIGIHMKQNIIHHFNTYSFGGVTGP